MKPSTVAAIASKSSASSSNNFFWFAVMPLAHGCLEKCRGELTSNIALRSFSAAAFVSAAISDAGVNSTSLFKVTVSEAASFETVSITLASVVEEPDVGDTFLLVPISPAATPTASCVVVFASTE